MLYATNNKERENMEIINLNVRTDKVLKEEARQNYNESDFTMTAEINLSSETHTREKRILLKSKSNVPNQETIDAIEEGRRIATDPDIKGYRSISDLRTALGV